MPQYNRMQQFSNSSELLTISCRLENVNMLPQMVQELSHRETDTHPQTDTAEKNTIFAMLSLYGW